MLVFFFQIGIVFANEPEVAVVVSDRIKPYMQVLKGLEQGVNDKKQGDENQDLNLDVFFLSTSDPQDRVAEKLLKDKYGLFVGIGPEAARLIWSMEDLKPRVKIFSAVLDSPISNASPSQCGISL